MKGISLSIALLIPILLSAQHQLGWRTDTYAGINSAFINPAMPARTPYAWDLNLVDVSQFLANNYGYVANTSTRQLLETLTADEVTYILATDIGEDFTPKGEPFVYDFYDNDGYYAQQQLRILGPSLSVQVAPLTRVGLFTSFQTHITLQDLDRDLGYHVWNNTPTRTDIRLDEMQISGAAWREVGINFVQGIEVGNGLMHIGISARRLWGQRGGYFQGTTSFDLQKLEEGIGLEGSGFVLDGGFTTNLLDENVEANEQAGQGWGVDIGWLYQIEEGDGFPRWEIGLALIDLGRIRFDQAEAHTYTSDQLVDVLQIDYENFDTDQGIGPIADQFSEDVFNLTDASLTGNSFDLRLATTISAQVRYNATEWASVEANAFYGFRPQNAGLKREMTLAVTPRIDRYWWSLAMPVSHYPDDGIRLGLAARLGPIVLGTDKLGAFFEQQEWTGADAYLAIKWFPLGLNRSGKNKRGKKRNGRRRGNEVECYSF